MKRLFKKNQIIITTLAIMIAVAGYLNYSGRILASQEKQRRQMVNLQIRSCLTLLRKMEHKKLPVILKVRIRKWQTERWKEHREKQCLPMEM